MLLLDWNSLLIELFSYILNLLFGLIYSFHSLLVFIKRIH